MIGLPARLSAAPRARVLALLLPWLSLEPGCSSERIAAPTPTVHARPARGVEPPTSTPSDTSPATDLAPQLGATTAETEAGAPLVEAAELPLDPSPPGPVLTSEFHRLRYAAQRRVLGRESPPGPHALPYTPFASEAGALSEVEFPALGHFVRVENEPALAHFHEALARLSTGKDPDGKVRILAYGASHTQADLYTGYWRAYLQSRFGDGGRGFVLLGRVNHWYGTLDTLSRHQLLKVHHSTYRADVQDEPLGLFGAALVGERGGAFGEVTTADTSPNTHFEIHYARQPRGGDFTLSVDGQAIHHISTQATTLHPAHHSFAAAPGRHIIRAQLHGNGPVRLFGIVAETAGPGVVVDTLGIGGSRISALLRWDEEGWIEAVRQRDPALVTFAYGTNESVGTTLSASAYERDVRAVLTRLRKAVPEVSCVFISPFDVHKPPHGARATLASLRTAIDVQRRISQEFGCGFWDGFAFMGGEGSMHRWATAKPPLAQADHIHLTRLGYVYTGIALGDALLRAYDLSPEQRRLEAAGSPEPPVP